MLTNLNKHRSRQFNRYTEFEKTVRIVYGALSPTEIEYTLRNIAPAHIFRQ